MKLCPTCRATYLDDTLSFCLNDGVPLLREPSTPDPQATVVLPVSQNVPNRQMLRSGGNLCGDGPATGKINQDGIMNLTGKLSCAAMTFPLATRCQFTTTTTLNCAYTLTTPRGYTPPIQHGTIQVTKH